MLLNAIAMLLDTIGMLLDTIDVLLNAIDMLLYSIAIASNNIIAFTIRSYANPSNASIPLNHYR